MANKKKTTKKSTSSKNNKKINTKKTSAKTEKELKKSKIKEEELEEELEDELDEAYEDEYELDEEELEENDDFEEDEEELEDEEDEEDEGDFEEDEEDEEDEGDFEEDEEELEENDDFDEDEEELEEEDDFDEDEEELEDEDDFEEEKPLKKKSTKEDSTDNKKVLWIVLACVAAFLVLSFILPANPSKDTNGTVEVTEGPKVSDWVNDSKTGKVVTVIASSTCPHCQEYRPVIEKLSKENDFKLYFFEADGLSEDDQVTLLSTYELSDYEGSVPFTFIVDSGKVTASTVGYATEDATIEFLQKNKIMK